MRRVVGRMLHAVVWLVLVIGTLGAVLALLALGTPVPKHITYGVTFSKYHADELGLDWRAAYDAILGDLNVKHVRLVAHWPMVEPKDGTYDFSVIDYQMAAAASHHADVILGVGRRLPSWPECHVPDWAKALDKAHQDQALLDYETAVVNRYKDSPAVKYWQVENEAFIIGYAYTQCGKTDVALLDKEIALVKSLDPTHPVLITDSGELSPWYQAWNRGDIFGTTLYKYMWNPVLGEFTYPLPAWFYRARLTLMRLVTGRDKPAILAELEAEPWLLHPIIETPIATQVERMSIHKFDNILSFAAQSGLATQYLWGVEWWYYLKVKDGHPEFWNHARHIVNP